MIQQEGLDPTLPINEFLAKKFDIPPLVVAYIRAALLREDHKYNKQTLIYHITEENIDRKKEIQKLQYSMNETNVEQVRKQVQDIQKKIDFRQGVVAVLRQCDDVVMRDLLRPNI